MPTSRPSRAQRLLALVFMAGLFASATAVGCGSSLTSKCKTICENLAKCNAATQCNCENNANNCSNADEMVSYLEDCSSKPCDEQLKVSTTGASGCMTTIPACKPK
jgi:hypothetical protein